MRRRTHHSSQVHPDVLPPLIQSLAGRTWWDTMVDLRRRVVVAPPSHSGAIPRDNEGDQSRSHSSPRHIDRVRHTRRRRYLRLLLRSPMTTPQMAVVLRKDSGAAIVKSECVRETTLARCGSTGEVSSSTAISLMPRGRQSLNALGRSGSKARRCSVLRRNTQNLDRCGWYHYGNFVAAYLGSLDALARIVRVDRSVMARRREGERARAVPSGRLG